jgi:endonuclease G, mitochondrial
MVITHELEAAVRSRLATAATQIKNSLEFVRQGNPLGAEWDNKRLIARLQTKALLSRDEAEAVTLGIRALATMGSAEATVAKIGTRERIYGSTIDFVSVSFLERGMKASQAVARVAFLDGSPQGSGFMVSDRLFLTNNHVIPTIDHASALCIEFDYELDPAHSPKGPTRFSLDPTTFFITDDENDLDYTLIAVGDRLSGPRRLAEFGFCPLSQASDKHALGEVANIVQHPNGRYKEIVLRENRLVSRLEHVLHYVADTEPGSSGSPVFNNEWRVIALHHWGGPWRQKVDDQGQPLPGEINEGLRVSSIVSELRDRTGELTASQRALLEQAIQLEERSHRSAQPPTRNSLDHNAISNAAHIEADGRVTWRIPLEISVRLPQAMNGTSDQITTASATMPRSNIPVAEAKIKPSKDYTTRSGYKPRFITGHVVDLPLLTDQLEQDAALNQKAEAGDDPHELKYHHFSIVMNKKKKFAFFTACNIDGSSAKKVDRKTGTVSVLEPDDPGLESIVVGNGAEASEKWYSDDRLLDGDYTNQTLYDRQQVPGFPDPTSSGRIARMLQRGHLVRRMDPAWGNDQQALLADADTFHFTNCVPQLGFFNMGTASKLNLPETGGGKLWRALENHVLRNAVVDKKRICSFTGPIFDKEDPSYRGIKVPLRFWKIVVWAENHDLRSLAMIADQAPVLEAIGGLPEAATDAEAFDELDKVRDFLSTVTEIESLTKLNFGDAVRHADIRAGESLKRVMAFAAIGVKRLADSQVYRRNSEKSNDQISPVAL